MPKDRVNFDFRVCELRKFALLSTCVAALASASAAETPAPSVQSILSTMNAAGGSEIVQWQIAPTYSELFGLGVRGAVGGYINEDFALGVIIDYAKHREEYLANAGVRLNESLRIIGTVGLLNESEEFTLGEGREDVRQLQYGLSLKGSYDAGIVRGYEINAYHTNASSDTGNVETGELTGLQLMTQLQPSANSNLRLGAGYERAEWDGGETNEGFTVQAIGSQKLANVLSIDYSARSGQTESAFGLGLTYDLSTPNVQSSKLAISLDRINGRNGISDDTRVAVTWTVGLGAPASRSIDTTMSSRGGMSTLARQDLLAEVMTRPAFLPKRVMARAAVGGSCSPVSTIGAAVDRFESNSGDYVIFNASTLPQNVTALIPLERDPQSLTPGLVDFYINGVRYTGAIHFYVAGAGELFFELADSEAFTEGDAVRVVFNADGGCSEITFLAVADDSKEPGPPSAELCSTSEITVNAGLDGSAADTFLASGSALLLNIDGSVETDTVAIGPVTLSFLSGTSWGLQDFFGITIGEAYELTYNGNTCSIIAVDGQLPTSLQPEFDS